jgi:uncharacterized protein with GYD domain
VSYYLFQWRYKDASIKSMVDTPHDRSVELRKAVEAFGGTLHQFFYAFGDVDGIAVVEFAHPERCAACSFALNGHGANAMFETMALMTPEEGWRAMRLANEIETGYMSPIGYTSHG